MRSIRLSAFAILASLAIPAAHAGPFSAIYSFGDSLSDVGNDYNISGGTLPGAPYSAGRFSNGPIWIDDLAASLGLTTKASQLGGTNYAYGGAETGITPIHPSPVGLDLLGPSGQIAQFAATHSTAPSSALYTLWIGANDLDDVLLSNPTPSQVQANVGAIVGNIDTAIKNLAALGAKNFLIVTVPDLGKTPAALGAGASAAASAAALSGLFDSTLVNGAGMLPSLASLAASSGLNLSVLDTYSLLDAIVANGAAGGFTNTTAPCLTGEVNFAGGTPCSPNVAVQNQYVFWDQKHPTSGAQALVAAQALGIVTPEPGTVLLLVSGLAGIGWMRRRAR